jgi:hypothetical protein
MNSVKFKTPETSTYYEESRVYLSNGNRYGVKSTPSTVLAVASKFNGLEICAKIEKQISDKC